MAVYVDNIKAKWRGKVWCHMVADSIDELHEFAISLGLRKAWFQDRASYPHYDITLNMRSKALSLGAHEGDKKTVIECAKKLRIELRSVGQP